MSIEERILVLQTALPAVLLLMRRCCQGAAVGSLRTMTSFGAVMWALAVLLIETGFYSHWPDSKWPMDGDDYLTGGLLLLGRCASIAEGTLFTVWFVRELKVDGLPFLMGIPIAMALSFVLFTVWLTGAAATGSGDTPPRAACYMMPAVSALLTVAFVCGSRASRA